MSVARCKRSGFCCILLLSQCGVFLIFLIWNSFVPSTIFVGSETPHLQSPLSRSRMKVTRKENVVPKTSTTTTTPTRGTSNSAILTTLILTTTIQRVARPGSRLFAFFAQNRTLRRADIGPFLDQLGLKTGAEVGVAAGDYALALLRAWPSCEQFYLVDLWKQQKNYRDMINLDDANQEQKLVQTKERMMHYQNKTTIMRMRSTEAAKLLADQSLDFVYIDARHDYCGVKEDVEAWWPKLKLGGIFAGHDYFYVQRMEDNWALCEDGSRHVGGVKRAVDEFAKEHDLDVYTVTEHSGEISWVTEKLVV